MKLNLAKCVFAVASRKFLEFMVSQWGIEANLDQVKTIIKVKSQKKSEGGTKLDKESCSPKQIRL